MDNWLFGKTLSELQQITSEAGMPRFSAKQVAGWLYRKGAAKEITQTKSQDPADENSRTNAIQKPVDSIEQMSNLSHAHRIKLSEHYQIGHISPSASETSADGTKKYLFDTLNGKHIESAYIPDGDRATLCVSSQAGCKMGCLFCMTARQGFQHNLTCGEILNQIVAIPEHDKLTNIVYMGMGEPLDNVDNVLRSLEILTSEWGYGWSPSRITVSTIGIERTLDRFLTESEVHIAVSLHNPFAKQREEIMPAQRTNPIHSIIETLKKYDFTRQRRVSFEYIVMEGLNDSPVHVKELCRLLDGLKCRINLIKFHKIPDSAFFSPRDEKIVAFRNALTQKGIITTIRTSRGEDIKAACGLLSTLEGK